LIDIEQIATHFEIEDYKVDSREVGIEQVVIGRSAAGVVEADEIVLFDSGSETSC
jgi:hypothetical protein